MFYIITITVGALIITVVNFLTGGDFTLSAFAWLLLKTLLGVVAVIAVDGLVAFIARRLPERLCAPEARLFTVPKWEHKLYRKTKINTWKKYVPELGCFTGFHKDKMRDPTSSEYIGRFLLESNYGVLGHVLGAIFGFLIMLIPIIHPLKIALPIAIINLILSMLPTFILRYNTPALRKIYRRNLAREKSENKRDSTEA